MTRLTRYYRIVKKIGVKIVLKEIIRRTLGMSYTYKKCLQVRTDRDFRGLYNAIMHDIEIKCLNEMLQIITPYGIIEIPSDFDIFNIIHDIFHVQFRYYSVIKKYFKNKKLLVIDVGSFIGDSVLLFSKFGAQKIIAYEPVPTFFNLLQENIVKNELGNKVILKNYGLWFEDCKIPFILKGPGTKPIFDKNKSIKNYSRIKKFITLKEIVREYRELVEYMNKYDMLVSKFDCEGCEYSLLIVPDELLKIFDVYIIEIHGVESPILWKMTKNNYRSSKLVQLPQNISLWLFEKNHLCGG